MHENGLPILLQIKNKNHMQYAMIFKIILLSMISHCTITSVLNEFIMMRENKDYFNCNYKKYKVCS